MMASRTAPALALGAAVLFGLSTPAARLLVGTVDPWLLAGVLYLGSGGGLTLYRWSRHLFKRVHLEPPVNGTDLYRLGGAILFGGIIAPVLLTYGLAMGTAVQSFSLLRRKILSRGTTKCSRSAGKRASHLVSTTGFPTSRRRSPWSPRDSGSTPSQPPSRDSDAGALSIARYDHAVSRSRWGWRGGATTTPRSCSSSGESRTRRPDALSGAADGVWRTTTPRTAARSTIALPRAVDA